MIITDKLHICRHLCTRSRSSFSIWYQDWSSGSILYDLLWLGKRIWNYFL